MVEYEELYIIVKKRLSEKRFKHSEGVVKRALEYSEIYGVDKEITRLVAIAHDIAKELTEEEFEKYINEYKIELDEIERKNISLLHAKIGAYICKYEFGFSDDMVNAVKFHTTGRENMTILEKIIYLADATEENRDYNYSEYVELIKSNINNGMFEVAKWVIKNLIEKNKMIHLDSIKCYNFYFQKIEQNPCQN